MLLRLYYIWIIYKFISFYLDTFLGIDFYIYQRILEEEQALKLIQYSSDIAKCAVSSSRPSWVLRFLWFERVKDSTSLRRRNRETKLQRIHSTTENKSCNDVAEPDLDSHFFFFRLYEFVDNTFMRWIYYFGMNNGS